MQLCEDDARLTGSGGHCVLRFEANAPELLFWFLVFGRFAPKSLDDVGGWRGYGKIDRLVLRRVYS